MKLSCKKGTSYLIFIYLCPPKWFRIRIQRTTINRESGVSPGPVSYTHLTLPTIYSV